MFRSPLQRYETLIGGTRPTILTVIFDGRETAQSDCFGTISGSQTESLIARELVCGLQP